MTWGCDTRHYPTLQAMQAEFPDCLAAGQTRVLKQDRGSSGDGVWKVEPAEPAVGRAAALSPEAPVRVRHAKRGSVEEEMPLNQFLLRCEPYFNSRGGMRDESAHGAAARAAPLLPAHAAGLPATERQDGARMAGGTLPDAGA